MARLDPTARVRYHKHMKKLYVSTIVAIMGLGLFLTFKFGYKPAPVAVMEPTHFAQAEDIGVSLYREVREPLERSGAVVFGVPPQPEWNQKILRGFMKAAADEGRPFEVLLAEPEMPALDLSDFPEIEVKRVPMNTRMAAEFADALQSAKAAGRRTLVYTASLFSTPLLVGNPLTRFEKITGENLFTITAAPLALRHDQEFLIDPPCVGSERDMAGTAPLGCEILSTGRALYKQSIAQDRFVAYLKKDATRDDYLLLVSYPGQARAGSIEGNQAFRMKAPGVMGSRGLPTKTSPDTLPAERPTAPAM